MLKVASTTRGPSLSKAWEVSKAHKGAFSGGKVELSRDGKFLACLYEWNVSFVDVEEGVVTKRLRSEGSPGGEEEIVSFALHPNGSEIVTASRSLLLRHWEIATGDCKRAIKAHDHIVRCMDYDGTGTLVATGSSDSTAKVWDVERGYCTHNFRGHTGVVSVVAFHPDPKRLTLVTGSEDTTVRVWSLSEQSCTAVLKAHLSYVTSLAFLPGGTGVISGGRDRVLNVWALDRSEVRKTFPVYEEVEGLQVLPQSEEFSENFPVSAAGSLVAVAGKNGVVRVFSLEGTLVEAAAPGKGNHKLDGAKKKNRKSTVTAASDRDEKEQRLTCRCVMTQDNASASHRAGYTSLLLDPRRGGLLAVTADHNLVLLEASGNRRLGETPGGAAAAVGPLVSLVTRRQIVGYNDEVIDVKSFPSGGESDGESWVAVATNSPQVRLFELGSFSCRLLDGHTDTVLALDVAPDGRHLCTSSKDRTCLLWNVDLGVPVVRWSGHADSVGAVAASRKPGPWNSSSSSTAGGAAAFVVSGAADRTLQRWDVPCRPLAALEGAARDSREAAAEVAAEAAAEADGKGKGSGGGTGVWTPPAPLLETARRSVRAHEQDINCVAVSPNDAVVASASQDRTIKLWKAADLELTGVLKGHKRGVWKVEFSPVDRCLASCSGDRTVKLWSLADLSCLRTFQGHTASVLSVAFVSAGAQVVSGGADGLVKVWTVRSDECEATLDAHTDKVWALTTAAAPAVRRHRDEEEEVEGGGEGPNAGIVVVSGGADSVINVWKDVTAREEEKVIAERENALLKEQELYNRLRNKEFGPAIALALELKRPQKLWGVLRDAMTEGMGEGGEGGLAGGDEKTTTEMASRRLDEHVSCWTMDTISQCLGYCRDWNTNARKAVVVHALVGSILRCVSITSLKELPGCAELVRVLLPYSERHFQRLDRLLQSSYLVEHTLASMQMLVAEGGPAGDSNKAAAGTKTNRPLVRELKRLRNGKPRQEEVEGVDGGVESDSEGEDKVASPMPVSEVVDGRVVFNVRVENGGAGDSDSEEEDSDLQESDVVMGDASKRDPPSVVEGGGGERSATKPKKKRKKKSSSGASAPTTLGLVGQPVVEAVVPAEGAEELASASGDKKGRKKRRRSAGDAKNVAGASPALVKVQKQSVGAVVPEEGGAVAETGEDGGGSGKKKKKKRSGKGRRKSTTT
ncbi:unnamed protein product [Ectocarpus sp. 4 AP-2014]